MGSLAVARLQQYSETFGLEVEVRVIEVNGPLGAPVGYMGSPTIIVAGLDIDPSVRDHEGTGEG